jgi:hypothetical protein
VLPNTVPLASSRHSSVLLASSQQRCALQLKKDYMTDNNLGIFREILVGQHAR